MTKQIIFVLVIAKMVLVCGTGAQAVDMEWVIIRDAGNVDDIYGAGYGGVGYTYRIGKYEVTNSQYCDFLNAVAVDDTYNLYNTNMNNPDYGGITRSGSPPSYLYSVKTGRGNWPVNYVSFYDVLRFCNWLHNGKPSGAQDNSTTEDGAYTLTGPTSVVVGDHPIHGANGRNADARVWLTSEDEWYKAAYYKGGRTDAGYWDYATQSNTLPDNNWPESDTGNSANYDHLNVSPYIVDVDDYNLSASAYGTLNQNGNMWEWNEAQWTQSEGLFRGYRDGGWSSGAASMPAYYRTGTLPIDHASHVGFRVASSGIIHVDANAPGPLHDGFSWSTAYKYLQDALAGANSNPNINEIWVAQGTYTPDSNSLYPNGSGDRTATFQLISGVVLKGGYAGYGASNPYARDIDLYETILSGDLNGDDVGFTNNGENSYHVVTSGETATLEGLTITGGNANGSSPLFNYGGGVYLGGTIRNCTISGNYAATCGGGVHKVGSITNSNISGNSTGVKGGGVYRSPLTNCLIVGNSAHRGGGVYAYDGSIINCTFEDNSASWGGAVYNYTTASMTNCKFIGNRATWGSGVHITWSSTIKNCLFVSCGLETQGNYGTYVRNCTFINGGLICNYAGASNVHVTNSIFWDTSSGISSSCDSIATATYSDIAGGWPGEGNIDIDPLFVGRELSGGHLKSQGGRWDPTIGSWIQDDETSPCIDAGDPDSSIGYELFPNGGRVNMGCYGGTTEASKSYFDSPVCKENIAGDINGDCIIDFVDFAFMASHWLEDNRK